MKVLRIYKFCIQNLLVFFDCLNFKEKTFYEFEDIPRRFLPCSYFKLIIYQEHNIPPVVDVTGLTKVVYINYLCRSALDLHGPCY